MSSAWSLTPKLSLALYSGMAAVETDLYNHRLIFCTGGYAARARLVSTRMRLHWVPDKRAGEACFESAQKPHAEEKTASQWVPIWA